MQLGSFHFNVPLTIFEDKLAQFQVAEYNSAVMTVSDAQDHLIEQPTRFLFVELSLASYVLMHVAMVTGKEDVRFLLSEKYFVNWGYVVVRLQFEICSKFFGIFLRINNL